MEINASSVEPLVAARGVIIYSQGSSGFRHATIHDIDHDKKGNPSLKAGVGMTAEQMADMLRELIGSSPLAYRDETVLAEARDQIVWWCPPSIRTLFIKNVADDTEGSYDNLPTLSLRVPVPGLVFCAKQSKQNSTLLVAAVAEATRPTPRTTLYRAPFANTYDTGDVCMGSMRVSSDPREAERQFFDSVFTHDVGKVSRVKGHVYSWQAWDKLAKRKSPGGYPVEWLYSANIAVEGFLRRGAAL